MLHVFVGVSRETWWVGDGLECVSPPLLAVVRIDVSRETSAFPQAIFPVLTVVFYGKRQCRSTCLNP